MNGKACETIMNLRGYDEFKALAKRLCQLAQRRRELSGVRAPLPNFLFVEAPGAGVTTQLKLLTRLLMELKLMRFAGERRFFEWTLDRDAFEKGGSFDRLLQETAAMAGFYSQFRGYDLKYFFELFWLVFFLLYYYFYSENYQKFYYYVGIFFDYLLNYYS